MFAFLIIFYCIGCLISLFIINKYIAEAVFESAKEPSTREHLIMFGLQLLAILSSWTLPVLELRWNYKTIISNIKGWIVGF